MTDQVQDERESLKQKILSLDGLPPFPSAASQILSECQKSDVDVRAVAQLVECDAAICSKVIQLANSPLYGTSRPISTISQAIVLLGFKTVSQLAVSIAAGALFENDDEKTAHYHKQTFRQSIACAITSKMFAGLLNVPNPAEAFLCGILHDVGKLAFFDVSPNLYCDILENSASDNTTQDEQAEFGVDHTVIGKKCGIKWGFPTPINRAIERHHNSFSESTHELSKSVIAGNYFSRSWELATENKHGIQDNEILDAFSDNHLETMREKCQEQFEIVIDICAA